MFEEFHLFTARVEWDMEWWIPWSNPHQHLMIDLVKKLVTCDFIYLSWYWIGKNMLFGHTALRIVMSPVKSQHFWLSRLKKLNVTQKNILCSGVYHSDFIKNMKSIHLAVTSQTVSNKNSWGYLLSGSHSTP